MDEKIEQVLITGITNEEMLTARKSLLRHGSRPWLYVYKNMHADGLETYTITVANEHGSRLSKELFECLEKLVYVATCGVHATCNTRITD